MCLSALGWYTCFLQILNPYSRSPFYASKFLFMSVCTSVCPYQSWFLFSNLNLPQPNVKQHTNVYTMLSITQHRSSLNFSGASVIVLELWPFTNGKKLHFSFPFSYWSIICLNQILKNTYTLLITTKLRSSSNLCCVNFIVLQ